MKRALLILLALVIALPLAALVAAHFALNEDALRARAVAAVQKATGRELTIAGPIRLAWSLTPTIEANDISLANPPGFSRPALAHIDRVTAKLALIPLLSHRVEVSGVTLVGPTALFERDAQGRPNWDFARPTPSGTAPAAPAEAGQKFAVQVGEIIVTDAKLAFKGDQLAAPRLTYDPLSGRIAGDLAYRGTDLHLAGTAGPVGAPPIPLDLHLEGGGLKLTIAGTSAAATLLAEMADLSTLGGPALRNIRLGATATLAPASLALDGIQLTSTQGDLAGNLVVAGNPRATLRGALSSTHFDLDFLTPPPSPSPSPSPSTPTQPAGPAPSLPSSAPRPPTRLIPDTPIPYATLRGADVDLQLNAAALAWRGKQYTKIAAHIALQDGKLRLGPASMALGDKTLSAQIQADAAAQTMAATIDAPGLPAGPVSTLLGGPAATGTLDLRADLSGQGATWRAVAATLHGNVGLAMVDGEIDNTWLLDKLQDALRAANLPVAAAADSKVRCAALRLDAETGKARLQTLTLDTGKLKLDGSGVINLADETLDLHLRPTIRLGAALSVPVRVGGTLLAPKAALDPGAIMPGRVGISIGGPPPPDTCGPALALARGGESGPPPAPPEPASKPMKPADLLRGLLR